MIREQMRADALSAIQAALEHLANYAQTTDSPQVGMVDAADLLDAAAACFALADFADAIKGSAPGDE